MIPIKGRGFMNHLSGPTAKNRSRRTEATRSYNCRFMHLYIYIHMGMIVLEKNTSFVGAGTHFPGIRT